MVLYVYMGNGEHACVMNRSRRSFEGTDRLQGISNESKEEQNSSGSECNTSWQGGRKFGKKDISRVAINGPKS